MTQIPSSGRSPATRARAGALARFALPVVLAAVLALLLAAFASLAVAGDALARGLAAPRPLSPRTGLRVQQLPAITWSAVHGAAAYEYQLSGDARFRSIPLGQGRGKGVAQIHNLAASLEKQVSDGTYYWRVRALTRKDRTGPWSKVRRIVKRWTQTPRLTAGDGVTVNWPSTPLVLRWTAVPYAFRYIVTVATDPGLANVVLGTRTKPVYTQGINYAMPTTLSPGQRYYWAITPVDAEGHRGTRSGVGTFVWQWPTTTATSVTDLNPSFGAFDDPLFSWNPVPGAARYEVEINAAQSFAPGSKWCCTGTTLGTSLAPLKALANNRYYWRVRAIDAGGKAGVWNYGQTFEKAFDPGTPSVPNVTVRNVNGQALGGVPATDTPLVTWDPVPGASRYEVQIGVYEGGFGCDWSLAGKGNIPSEPTTPYHAFTATTAWTPLANPVSIHTGPTAWPNAQRSIGELPTGASYCFRVLARSDDDAQREQVVSAWTQVNGANQPAFTYTAPPPAGKPGPEGLVTPSGAYIQPGAGITAPRTPLFTWNRVAGANGYYVVIARDPRFTEVSDVGFTHVPAYAPRLANEVPLRDETTEYFWAVIPTAEADGLGVFSTPCYTTPFNPCGSDNDHPQVFNKASTPPAPISPLPGAVISGQPTFRWSEVENARTYQLQVAQDEAFSKPVDDVTTDATAYTSSATYPADTTLYWRVRGNDWTGHGMAWSALQVFRRALPAPVPTPYTAADSVATTPLSWSAVPGAIAYDVHIDQPDGKQGDITFEAPSASATEYYGTGYAHWKVRAEFPTAAPGGRLPGPYSTQEEALLKLPPPSGAHGVKSGSRLLVTWQPEKDAKRYRVEISKSNGFAARIEQRTVSGTSWAPNIDLARKLNRGTLYWRVAPVDARQGVGSFAAGTFGGKKGHAKRRARRRHR